MNERFVAELRKPGNQYRGAPFWAWNGQLDPAELRRQIRLMHRMGLGGFFMHARVGLNTAYLGQEWMDGIAACVDEAEKLDMQAWLYDEDRWPSGAAGGLVTKKEKYRMMGLVMTMLDDPAKLRWSAGVLAACVAKVDGAKASDVRPLRRSSRPGKLAKGERVLVFEVKRQATSSWFNGFTYLDTMNPEAVREFIRVTHETYRKRFGKELGKRIPGIFTDEPEYGHHSLDVSGGHELRVPWTTSVPKVFRQRYGYDLLPHLAELFFLVDGQTVSRVRWAYHDCITHLFVDAFSRQIGQWCDRAGCAFTGHVLYEPTLDSQTSMVGSCMRFYEHMQAPGMDILTEHWREYDTAKQVSSAARQFGRRWRLTETYGCTGWDFPFAGHKALGDWQAALGINLRCQHLSWYTMEGEAKRDYPAAIFYQSPWWESYPKVEDYFARVHVAMSRGQEVRELLVVHPVESTWSIFVEGAKKERQTLQESFWRVRDTLLAAHLDFDYGDEDILRRHSRITRQAGRPVLHVGQARYHGVIVPSMLTIRSSTLKLLKQFQAAGGTVIFAGSAPEYVDAQANREAAELAKRCRRTAAHGPGLATAAGEIGRRVSITDAAGREIPPALYCLREDKDAYYLFVANSSDPTVGRREAGAPVRQRRLKFDDVRVRLWGSGAGEALEANCETGELVVAEGRKLPDGWEIRTTLAALGSHLFVLPKQKTAKKYPRQAKLHTLRTQTLKGDRWEIALSEPNVLVLDRPRYRLAGGAWHTAKDVLMADCAVREAMGLPRRGGTMIQPWAREKPAHSKQVRLELEYEFTVEAVPTGALWLALEQLETFEISLNGRSVSTDADSGWWVDRSLRKVPLDAATLRPGRNLLRLVCDYREDHPGLEIMYLLGTFGSITRGTEVVMKAAPTGLRLGDWVKQGLAFYSGSVTYLRTVRVAARRGERVLVEVPGYQGAAVRILVDGEPAGIIGWEPNEVDITDLLADKSQVRLGIEVLGHRRNSHGPLHLKEKWPVWVGPEQFVDEKNWFAGYQLVACGLTAAPRVSVRK